MIKPATALILLTYLLFNSSFVYSADGAYYRALGLVEEDPLEADALIADAIKTTSNPRIRRAAKYDLFYLRLRLARFNDAYTLAATKGMRTKFVDAAATYFRISETRLKRILAVLDEECAVDGDISRVAGVLTAAKSPAAVYDFAIGRLENCKLTDAIKILPDLPDESAPVADARLVNIYLLRVRLLIVGGDLPEAAELLKAIRALAEKLIAENKALATQLIVTEARYHAMAGNRAELVKACNDLQDIEGAGHARRACSFLLGFVKLREKDYAAAARVLSPLKVESREIDNRLLKLCAAVAGKRVPATKLVRFTRRASYRYQAQILRDLVTLLIAENGENK